MDAATQVAALRTAIAAAHAVDIAAAATTVVVEAARVAEAAATAVVDTGNYGLRRKIEFPLMDEKARLLRQAGFLFVLETYRYPANSSASPPVPPVDPRSSLPRPDALAYAQQRTSLPNGRNR